MKDIACDYWELTGVLKHYCDYICYSCYATEFKGVRPNVLTLVNDQINFIYGTGSTFTIDFDTIQHAKEYFLYLIPNAKIIQKKQKREFKTGDIIRLKEDFDEVYKKK